MNSLPQRAVLLVRISDDKAGDEVGVKAQEVDGRRLAAQLGWSVAELIVENSTSAFKRKRIRTPSGKYELRTIRPGFRRALELLESGACDGFIAYDLDRALRDPRDLEDLVDVVEQRTPRIPVRSVTGSLQLDNDADITMARVLTAIANKSSRDTQRRVKRRLDDIAAEGRYAGGGARRYGYERDGVTIVEHEAEAIREAARRVIAGDSVRSICRDFDERGVRPVKAVQWSTKALADILRSARIAGLRVHRGEVVGKAAWPAIIDDLTREQVLGRLAENASGRPVKVPLLYWCNQLLWCSRCGGRLAAAWSMNTSVRSHRYWCTTIREPKGCGGIAVNGPGVESEIERQMLAFLARKDVIGALASASSNVAVEETRRLAEDDEKQLLELAAAHGNKEISMAEWLAARAPVQARLKTYRAVLGAVVPAAARKVIDAEDQAAAWAVLEPAEKRELVRVVLRSAGYVGWTVAPADLSKPRRFDPTRLTLRKDEASEERAVASA